MLTDPSTLGSISRHNGIVNYNQSGIVNYNGEVMMLLVGGVTAWKWNHTLIMILFEVMIMMLEFMESNELLSSLVSHMTAYDIATC